eukprot:37868_1
MNDQIIEVDEEYKYAIDWLKAEEEQNSPNHDDDIGFFRTDENDISTYDSSELNNFTKTTTGINFVQPLQSDYIDCQDSEHEATNCNVMKRIVFVLRHYHQHPNDPIYEYLSSLKNYNVSTFLEDWHQTKKNHLRGEDDVSWIKDAINIQCESANECQIVSRYQRKRG